MSTLRLSKAEPFARSLVEAIHAVQTETVKELVQREQSNDLGGARAEEAYL